VSCDEIRNLLDAWHDGELDRARRTAVERHLEGCAECASLSGAQQVLTQVITRKTPRYRAPSALRRRIEAELVTSAPPPAKQPPWRMIAIAASVGFFILLGWNASMLRSGGVAPAQDIASEIVADHIRSLMANHLEDVASEDRHTVKPWFMGKLDYSPPVEDFGADGFKLSGGRLDYAGGKPVAALVYRHRAHVINVFIWPTSEADHVSVEPRWSSDDGYHLARWTRDGMTYWAVSDVDGAALAKFVGLLSNK
jgi:mycothiol system anti-sigma-R factor